jgi:stage II sporulation protein D
MYYGLSHETTRTNSAVDATAGQVVKYGNDIAVTFYFSTSGGRTENVENVFIGHAPVPYLKSVDDPYDIYSPKHRWRFAWTLAQLDRKLGAWVKGKLRGIKVTQRGISPRIVTAEIIGTKGVTTVHGSELRSRLGLYDTWAYFTAIRSGQGTPPAAAPPPAAGPPAANPNGGSTPAIVDGGSGPVAGASVVGWLRRLFEPRKLILSGSISPAPERVLVQRLVHRRWTTFGQGHTDRKGRYSMLMPAPGLYRVLASGAAGPVTRIR